MQNKNANRRFKYATFFVFSIFIFLRFALSNRLPAYIMADSPHDDGWVVNHALNILKGEWLGSYDQFTLIKGSFSPLLLAFSTGIGLTYSGLNTILYCFACVLFIASIKPIIKNHWVQIFCFLLLLFNPITYALETGQRIYRNGIGQWEILLIFGCLLAVLLRRNEDWKSLLKWQLICGLAITAFLQTREDGLWIYPFIFVAITSTILLFLLGKEGPKKKIILFLLPVVITFLLTIVIAVTNYNFYGKAILNDRTGGNYSKVAGDLNLITPDADEFNFYESALDKGHYYNIYNSAMEKAFAASPTLNGVAQPIRDAIRSWGGWEDTKSEQLSTDHMLFALRDGVKLAGYYQSLPETEAFYGKVHKELQAAFEDGALVKRGFLISPLMVPIHNGDLGKAFSLMPTAIKNIINFSGVSSNAIPAKGSEIGIKKFSLMAGGDYLTSSEWLFGSGWAFADDDSIRLTAGLYNKQGTMLANLAFNGGEDVFKVFKFKYQNARSSRFSFKIDGYSLHSGLTLRFFDQNGNLFWEIPADGSATCGGQNDLFRYCIDNLKNDSFPEKFYTQFVQRANHVISLYQHFIPFLSMLACLIYFASTVLLFRDFIKKQVLNTLPVWLILTGLASTFVLFIFSMCLMTVRTFNTLGYLYSAPAYVLLLMFCVVSIYWVASATIHFRKYRCL